ncbi:hypothetical protein M3Y97_00587500 [Aphelenchoides bicaudatus]|nr:hypothetical protein M3Y97_00587500 [Aphelenchoides bicaudatus]
MNLSFMMSRDSTTSINENNHRFPFCIVWTPIPLITWLFPFIGHMGIATSKGVIRDFAGSYYVSEDDMAFGWPTSYLQLMPSKVEGGAQAWDHAVLEASEEYKAHIHNLICDNCHSHTALALNRMKYNGKSNWNMTGWDLKPVSPMVRLTIETITDGYQYINAVKQREISLRDLQIPAIENLGVTKDQFDVIDLTDNNIRKIDNLPLMKRLESILLHNNRIQYIQKDIGEKLPNLKTLALTNNNIAELGDILPLAKCTKLEYLSLMGNPLTHKPHYRAYIINKLPSVRVLDFRRIKDAERNEAAKFFKGEEGKKLEEQANTAQDQQQSLLEDGESKRSTAAQGRTTEELAQIEESIRNAKSLAEVEHLTSILNSGRIPGEKIQETTNGVDENGEEFEMETE